METASINLIDKLRMLQTSEKPFAQEVGEIQGSPDDGKLSFSKLLADSFEKVNREGIAADEAVNNALLRNEPNPHQALIAIQEAELSFSLMLSIKERLETAYQTVIRTQI